MNFKLTFVLVLVLIVITTLFVVFRGREPAKKEKPNETTALFATAPKDLKSVTYLRDGKAQVKFVKEGEKWKMTQPVDAAVEESTVSYIANTLSGMSFKEKFEPAESGSRSAADTGTQSPRNVVKFTDDAGKEYTLGLGKRTVGGVFATLNGGKTVYVLAVNPLDELDKDPQEFRAKHLQDVPQDNVTKLVVKHVDQAVELTKSQAGPEATWVISSPISARAEASKVKEMLGQIATINAVEFSDMTKDMPATGLNPPLVSVTAEYTEKKAPAATLPATTAASQPAKKAVTLELGYYTDLTDKKTVYASLAGSSQVFTMPADTFNKLNRQLKDLRDPAVTPAAVGDATHVKITSVDKTHAMELEKKDGKWQIASLSPAVKAGDLQVGDFLGDMRNLRAINFSDNAGDLKSIGLDPPQTTIDLTLPRQSQHEVILVGKPETADKVTPMMRQGEQTVYLVQTGDAEKILPTALTLRDREVERLPSERIRTVAISGAGAVGGGVTLQREGTSWKATSGGKSLKADDEKITTLLAEFTPLTAVKYESQDAAASGTPEVTVAVTFTEVAATTKPTTTEPAAMGPELGTTVTRTLKIYKMADGKGTSWKAVWDGPGTQWAFEPTAELVNHVTKVVYGVAAATQAASQPETEKK